MRYHLWIYTALAAATGLSGSFASAQDLVFPEAATGRYQKSGGEAKKFMVAAANPLAVKAGVDILKAGGSAADAAVAVQTVLNIGHRWRLVYSVLGQQSQKTHHL